MVELPRPNTQLQHTLSLTLWHFPGQVLSKAMCWRSPSIMVSTHWFIAMFTAQPGMFPLTSSWNSHRYSTCVIEIKIPINTRGHGSGHVGRDRICMPVGCGGRTCPSVLWRRAELAKNWSIRTTPCMHAASGTTKHTSQLKVRECRDSQHIRPKNTLRESERETVEAPAAVVRIPRRSRLARSWT